MSAKLWELCPTKSKGGIISAAMTAVSAVTAVLLHCQRLADSKWFAFAVAYFGMLRANEGGKPSLQHSRVIRSHRRTGLELTFGDKTHYGNLCSILFVSRPEWKLEFDVLLERIKKALELLKTLQCQASNVPLFTLQDLNAVSSKLLQTT